MDRKEFLKTGLTVTAGLPFAWRFLNRININNGQTDFNVWHKTGGPIGGLGYNVRYRPDNPETIFVTDAWSGLQVSFDSGQNWETANNGIDFRAGASSDAIPVFAFRIDPNDNNILWAGMEQGGGLYKSTDGGNSWVKKDNGINLDPNPDTGPITIRHIEVMPGNSDFVFVMGEQHTAEWGTEFEKVKGFIYHSEDGGENFTLMQEFNSLTRWLFINPENTDEMLVTTGIFDREAFTDDPDETYPSGPGLGVYRTVDGGQTWSASNAGIDPSKSMFIGGAHQDPDNPATLIIAAGNNNDYNKGLYGAIYRSTDFGQSWTDVSPSTFGWNQEPLTAVAFSPSNPSIVYVGSAQAIYRSADNGLNWTRHSGAFGAPYGPEGVRSGVPIDMVVSQNDQDKLYVNNYGGGVFKSEDGAQSWVSWSKGYTGADIHSIAVDPNDPERIMANGRSGVFDSDNSGDNWNGISNGPAAFPEGFGVAFDPSDPSGDTRITSDEHESYILISEDAGQNWESALYLETGAVGDRHGARNLVYAPSDPLIVYAGFMAAGFHPNPHQLDFPESQGVYRSADGGWHWNERNDGLPTGAQAKNVTDIGISYQNADLVYITLRDGGIYKSTDGGANWQDAKGNLPDGQSWDDIWHEDDPLPRHSLLSVAVHPDDDQVVYTGCNIFGVYKTEDGGQNWAQVLSPALLIDQSTRDHAHITSIVIDPVEPSHIYAAEWHGGVYVSKDNGQSWEQINDELSTRSVAMLKFSAGGEFLYAATQGEGVFRYQLREVVTTSTEPSLDVPKQIRLNQNYPNPFNPSTVIRYSLAQAAMVQLEVFDTSGRKVATLVHRHKAAGEHTVTFDASKLSSGIYLYKLNANGHQISRKMTLVK